MKIATPQPPKPANVSRPQAGTKVKVVGSNVIAFDEVGLPLVGFNDQVEVRLTDTTITVYSEKESSAKEFDLRRDVRALDLALGGAKNSSISRDPEDDRPAAK